MGFAGRRAGTDWNCEGVSRGFCPGSSAMDPVVRGNSPRLLVVRQGPASPRPDRFQTQRWATNRDVSSVGTSRHHAHDDRSPHGNASHCARAGLPDQWRHRHRSGQLRAPAGSSVVPESAPKPPRAHRRRWPCSQSRGRGACGRAARDRMAALFRDLSRWNRICRSRGHSNHRSVPAAQRQRLRRRGASSPGSVLPALVDPPESAAAGDDDRL